MFCNLRASHVQTVRFQGKKLNIVFTFFICEFIINYTCLYALWFYHVKTLEKNWNLDPTFYFVDVECLLAVILPTHVFTKRSWKWTKEIILCKFFFVEKGKPVFLNTELLYVWLNSAIQGRPHCFFVVFKYIL